MSYHIPDRVLLLETNDVITLKADNNKYLSLVERGFNGNNVYFLEAAKDKIDDWCKFTVFVHEGSRISLLTNNGKWLGRIERDMPGQSGVSSIEASKDNPNDPYAIFQVALIYDASNAKETYYLSLEADNNKWLGRIDRQMPDLQPGNPIEASKDSYCDPFARFIIEK